ncbi:hypothetical protein [Gluconobacter cerinus]|nr:hypothetical protein [Gluconobacter cerinus]
MTFLKVLPAEQRGVFRIGGRALDDAQVAQMACEHVDVLLQRCTA